MSVVAISANELKTKGVAILDKATADGQEAIITVRGKDKYVVLPMEAYNHLRECELEAAIQAVKNDRKTGKYNIESVDAHIRRVMDV
ncbi:MAG: type II toxin-antitoxin system Phd/YefM family antitoxin [Xanthomonadales bacterium]|nr:type II toxin-antitoxin system Phd/YefM family antitoxin [Xanthomonadales bacterium]